MTKTKANMCFSKTNFAFFYLVFSLYFSSTHTATFVVVNQCYYTVWAATTLGGGQRLNSGQSWTTNMEPNTQGSIWGRTNCSFDLKGRGKCLTGDCNGRLNCEGSGKPPNTMAKFSLNQENNLDYFHISLVDGFNIPMEIGPDNPSCKGMQCAGPIKERCPDKLRAPGGCRNPCQVFNKTDDCCRRDRSCGSTIDYYKLFFTVNCPNALIFHPEDGTGLFNCLGGTNYKVVFCPSMWPLDYHPRPSANTCPDGTDYWDTVVICPS